MKLAVYRDKEILTKAEIDWEKAENKNTHEENGS